MCLTATGAMAQVVRVDEAVSPYQGQSGVVGSLNSIGSDTLNNLMTLWQEGFRTMYPSVRVQVEAKGSSTAPPALIQGTAQLGPMSREMKASEIDAFEKAFGYKPTQVRVAVDALAVYVHKDNPMDEITIEQLAAIVAEGGATTNWSQIGVQIPGVSDEEIVRVSRQSSSGTYEDKGLRIWGLILG